MQVIIRNDDIAIQLPFSNGHIPVTIPDELTVGEFRQIVLNTLRFVIPDPRVYMSATIDDVEIVSANVDDIVKNSFRMLRSGLTVDVNILPSAYQRLQRAQQAWATL